MSILTLVITFLGSLFKSQRQLVLENLALRQQVTMLRQSVKRPRVTAADKLFCSMRYVNSTGNTAAHNPTHSTNPTPVMYPKALQDIIGVKYASFVGYIWSFFPPG